MLRLLSVLCLLPLALSFGSLPYYEDYDYDDNVEAAPIMMHLAKGNGEGDGTGEAKGGGGSPAGVGPTGRGGGGAGRPQRVLDRRGGRPPGGKEDIRAAYEKTFTAAANCINGSVIVLLTADAMTRTVDTSKQKHKKGSSRFHSANPDSERGQSFASGMLETTSELAVGVALSDDIGIVTFTGAMGADLEALLDSADVVSVEADCEMAIIPDTPDNETDDGRRRLVDTQDWRAVLGVPADNSWGSGVDIYIMDTGVDTTHPSFGGRAYPAWSGFNGAACDPANTSCAMDYDGHGTHCAGLAASADYGVARNATIHAVNICYGGCYWSQYLAAMDWVAKRAAATGRPSVLTFCAEVELLRSRRRPACFAN